MSVISMDDAFVYGRLNYDTSREFEPMRHGGRCHSCHEPMAAGDLALAIELEHVELGDDMPRTVGFERIRLCEECGEIFLNLEDAGCEPSPRDRMRELLEDYHFRTGFEPGRWR